MELWDWAEPNTAYQAQRGSRMINCSKASLFGFLSLFLPGLIAILPHHGGDHVFFRLMPWTRPQSKAGHCGTDLQF